ncbi:MAG: AmpG family muropeptide MFS transporter [Hyphomonadaceae bacterium]|nr:AmpG family muropeptide MFS transporter [Hyphomonadaceae bacterium]
MTDTTADTQPALGADAKVGIGAFFERASLVMFGLGFAAGMPINLAGAALAIWLREAGASVAFIALFGLATLTYSLKFLWAPVVDRVGLPILDKALGRRRSWMLLTQSVVLVGVAMMATQDIGGAFTPQGDPTSAFALFAGFTLLVAFAGATQDITIDAWRIEVARDNNRLGVLTATYSWGYRVAILLAGAMPLFIAQAINGDEYGAAGWSVAYLTMAGFMLIPIASTLLAPRENAAPAPRWTAPAHIKDNPLMEGIEWALRLGIMILAACFLAAGLAGKSEPVAWLVSGLYGGPEEMAAAFKARPWGVWQQVGFAIVGLGTVAMACMKLPGVDTKPAAYFKSALIEPLVDFFSRYNKVALLILAFICVYRISDFLLNVTSVLYTDAGYSKDQIAFVQKFFGAAMSALGAGVSGWLVLKVGLFRCLVVGAFLQPISNLAFAMITFTGPTELSLYLAIGIDNLSAAFAGLCLVVYMSMLTKDGFTATQYAFFSSLYSLPGKIISALSGRVVEGAAVASETGWLVFMKPWFAHLPPETFAKAGEKLNVSGGAMAAGYTAFFMYTALMGFIGIILAFVVSQGSARRILEKEEADERSGTVKAT